MFPIMLAKTGESLVIKKVKGNDEVKRHLETLGLVTGESVSIISKLAGNIIVNIRGSRIALDKATAGCIMVDV